MEIELNEQKKELKELRYLDAVEIEDIRQKDGLRAATKKFLIASGLTEEEAENLSLGDGLRVQESLNKITVNFQVPTGDKE